MSRIESALKQLAQGTFVCRYRYPEEFDALQDEAGNRKAQQWLETIGYRLARLDEEGAFFMAHAIVTAEMRAALRDEMSNIRTKLDPIVKFFSLLRESQGADPHMQPGDVIWEAQIIESVRASARLEKLLSEMRDMSGVRVNDSTNERVRRMLEILTKAGYIVETNAASRGFQIAGKAKYLYQMLGFINENTPLLSDEAVVDSAEDAQQRLDGPATPQKTPSPNQSSDSASNPEETTS